MLKPNQKWGPDALCSPCVKTGAGGPALKAGVTKPAGEWLWRQLWGWSPGDG